MFKIGKTTIEETSPAYIIAEVGVNHNGDVNLAKELIDVAVECGADAVKFQTFKAENLVSKQAEQAEYQINNLKKQSSQYEMLKELELDFEDFRMLKDYCERKGIEFISTPFDDESARFLKEIGVHAIKIGSGDLNNIPFLQSINELGIPVILSTGMANMAEVEEALDALSQSQVSILHCTSNYPAPYEDVNLKAMDTLKQSFNKITGYSDHTLGNEVSISAVTLGAKIIERHFTLDQELPGPDHKASLEPKDLKDLIKSVRHVEAALGDGIKKCMPSEEPTKKVARKSLIALKNIEPGDTFTEENIGIKRPGDGIEPKFMPLLLGRKAKNAIKEDRTITWDEIL
ncbi:N-acetylneuraminate synthase [Rossellomorea sp. NS-SX7]|uniref:N-acetylneuraminate synthase n=1 Tax=Rossellomorea sp. NS-SX7 TaxID=3463856 RepID=UPI0040581864